MTDDDIGKKEMIERFKAAFPSSVGYHYVFRPSGPMNGKQEGNSARIVGEPDDEEWALHIAGERGLGLVPNEGPGGELTRWGVIDVDEYGYNPKGAMREAGQLSLPIVPFRSKSNGVHFHVHVSEPIYVEEMQRVLRRIALALELPHYEVLPKQKVISDDSFGLGVNLPLFGRHRLLLILNADDEIEEVHGTEAISCMMMAVVDPATLRRSVVNLPDPQPESSKRAAARVDPRAEAEAAALNVEGMPFFNGPPCLQRIAADGKQDQGSRNIFLREAAVYAKYRGAVGIAEMVAELDALNHALFTRPLLMQEVKAVAKSVLKSDTGFSCTKDPLKPVCNRAICAKRQFGAMRRGLPPTFVFFNANEVIDAAKDMAEALGEIDPPTVFKRGSGLAIVVPQFRRDAYSLASKYLSDDYDGSSWDGEVMTIVDANVHHLQIAVHRSKVRQYLVQKGSSSVAIDPPQAAVTKMMNTPDDWAAPPLNGLTPIPLMRQDGSVRWQAGYDAATGVYYTGQCPEFYTPERPTQEDVDAAVETLLAPFDEFPFERHGPTRKDQLDRGALLALILTLAQRPLMDVSPMFGVSATKPGTGKDKLVQTCGWIVFGHPIANAMPIEDSRNREEEDRKRLMTFALTGMPALCISNAEGEVGSAGMAMMVTSTELVDRRLGHTEEVSATNMMTLITTGQNQSFHADMVRRSVVLKLDAGVENPEARRFKLNLPYDAVPMRPKLLGALYTVMRAWRQAGMPRGEPLGSFEAWSRLVADCVVWLGFPNPVETQKEQARIDSHQLAILDLLEAWRQFIGVGKPMTLSKVLEEAWVVLSEHDMRRGEQERFKEAIAAFIGLNTTMMKPTGLQFMGQLRAFKGAWTGGMRLVYDPERNRRLWTLETR